MSGSGILKQEYCSRFLYFVIDRRQFCIGNFTFQCSFLQILNICYLLVPLSLGDQTVALTRLQAIVDAVVLLENRFAVGFYFFSFVCSYLATSANCLTGSDLIAKERVICTHSQKILSTIPALARNISCRHSFEEIYVPWGPWKGAPALLRREEGPSLLQYTTLPWPSCPPHGQPYPQTPQAGGPPWKGEKWCQGPSSTHPSLPSARKGCFYPAYWHCHPRGLSCSQRPRASEP